MAKKDKKWFCLRCGVDTSTIGEHYFLIDEVWMLVHSSNKGMLCIGCVETKLGRKLKPADFSDVYINNPKKNGRMSVRLLDRLGYTKT